MYRYHPLTCRQLRGGGTAFWPDEAVLNVMDEWDISANDDLSPALVVAPPAGSAVLFVGSVTHAGIAVTAGERHFG